MVTTRKPSKPSKPHKPDAPGHHGGEHAGHDAGHEGHNGQGGGDANITMSIRLGPMVTFQVQGRNCSEINAALKGFEQLNRTVDAMFSDLAKRVYPEAGHAGDKE
jgi:hypothetical protein